MSYQDSLDPLNRNIPLREKLQCTHEAVRQHFDFVDRIAVAIYDPDTNYLKTYVDSSGKDNPLEHYEAEMTRVPSLEKLMNEGHSRIINNMVTYDDDSSEHTRRIGRAGYVASYTMPMFYNGVFFGFVFFNSQQRDVFQEEVLHELDLFGHMISLMVINELTAMRTLVAAVKTTTHITHQRDPETGSHLDRMSRYSRLIANALADKYELDDEYIEHVFMFSPLHDIGKIGIPDNILLKPASLDDRETEIMKSHTRKGREIIDDLLSNFGLDAIQNANILRNIAEYHHEAVNGSGYPEGKTGSDIPLESRIVAVADVFDALTSRRPYKDAWTNEDAFATLQRMAGEILDQDCVRALIDNRKQVELIQQQFQEDWYG
jgi:HD-GYP domain-containing protein (c-di-GMP phosphodiesterase class II)